MRHYHQTGSDVFNYLGVTYNYASMCERETFHEYDVDWTIYWTDGADSNRLTCRVQGEHYHLGNHRSYVIWKRLDVELLAERFLTNGFTFFADFYFGTDYIEYRDSIIYKYEDGESFETILKLWKLHVDGDPF